MRTSFWNRYFGFSGRINRLSFLLRLIFLAIVFVGMTFIFVIIITEYLPSTDFAEIAAKVIIIAFYLLLLIVFCFLQFGRLHDINLSGLWALPFIILHFGVWGVNVFGYAALRLTYKLLGGFIFYFY